MKVLISGAGISGLAAAHALARVGAEVEVVEAARAPRTGGYTLDLFGPGYAAAERLGVLEAILAHGRVYRAAKFVRADGRPSGMLPLGAFADLHDGRFVSITRGGLETALRTTLPRGIGVRFGARVAAVDGVGDGVEVRWDDGRTSRADLLLVAEGLHAATRRTLFPDASVRSLGYLTGACSALRPDLARTLGDTVEMSDLVGVQTGVYAMAGDTGVSAFVVAPGRAAPTDPAAWLRDRLRGAGPAADAAAEIVPDDDVFVDEVAQVLAPHWRQGRVLLMGDAAHAVSLIAGQGASLAIAGAEALAVELAATPDDLDAACGRYEERWRAVVEPVQEQARRSAPRFIPTGRWSLLMRRMVLRACAFEPIARIVARSIGGAPTH